MHHLPMSFFRDLILFCLYLCQPGTGTVHLPRYCSTTLLAHLTSMRQITSSTFWMDSSSHSTMEPYHPVSTSTFTQPHTQQSNMNNNNLQQPSFTIQSPPFSSEQTPLPPDLPAKRTHTSSPSGSTHQPP